MRRTVIAGLALVLLAAGGATPAGRQDAGVPIVERFLTREDVALERYEAVRTMHAQNNRFRKEASLVASTTLDPVNGFTFEVMESSGSAMIINRVLLPALKGEAELWQSKEPAAYGLTPDNYEFSLRPPPADGAAEVHVAITPRRKHLLLLTGQIVLSPYDGDLLRVEGRVSKNPSFWTTRVDVVRRYARIGGVRVPVELQSVANVRIAGQSELRTTYRYTSINGQPIHSDDIPVE